MADRSDREPGSAGEARSGGRSGGGGSRGGNGKSNRGFASMSPERQREIASKGGRAAHEKGTAHEWTPEEARQAGRKGGEVSRGGRGRLVDSNDSNDTNTPPSNGNLGMA